MSYAVPTAIERRPVAVVGGGTLGRRIALMFATRGGEVRIADPSAEQREAAAAYVRTRLPKVVQRLDGASAGTAAGQADISDAVAGAWLVDTAAPPRSDG